MVTEWWRIDGWPSAEEWQAVWALGAVLATIGLLAVAYFQLRGLAEANKLLAESNRALTSSNKALVRPYVIVDFGHKVHPNRDPRAPVRISLTLEVRNIGRTMAQGLRIRTTPELQSSLTIIDKNKAASEEKLKGLRKIFGGKTIIRNLAPKRTLVYMLDRLPEAMGEKGLPDGYDVEVTYSDMSGDTFSETYRIDFEGWKESLSNNDKLERISKDVQAINETLKSIAKEEKASARNLEEIAEALSGDQDAEPG